MIKRIHGVALPAIGVVVLAGCQGSSRTIHLKSEEITTVTPIQFARDAMPIAASPNGSRIAIAEESKAAGYSRVVVIDTGSQDRLATLDIQSGGQGTPMFSRDGTVLYLWSDEGYIAWDYRNGTRTKLADIGPEPREAAFLTDDGWNNDRTIAIRFPGVPPFSQQGTSAQPGQIATGRGVTQAIPVDCKAGFDQYGYAWFGKGRNWTKVDRDGRATPSQSHPTFLVWDQTKDRGSMHLTQTTTTMKHGDGRAIVGCIWLIDDRAVPYRQRDGRVDPSPYQAAVVFAGPDILEYGFLPGRDTVYVVSGFGNYLVPFTIGRPARK